MNGFELYCLDYEIASFLQVQLNQPNTSLARPLRGAYREDPRRKRKSERSLLSQMKQEFPFIISGYHNCIMCNYDTMYRFLAGVDQQSKQRILSRWSLKMIMVTAPLQAVAKIQKLHFLRSNCHMEIYF